MGRTHRKTTFVLLFIIFAGLLLGAGCGVDGSRKAAAQVLGTTRLVALKPVPGEARIKQLVTVKADGDDITCEELARAYEYEVSPDGKTIALVGDDGIYVTGLDGKGKTRISGLSPRFDLNTDQERLVGGVMAWSPDGRRLAFVCGGDLYVTEAKGGQEPELVAKRTPDDLKTVEGAPALAPRIKGIVCPAWTDDGNIIYQDFFSRYDGNWEYFSNIMKISAAGRNKTVLIKGGEEPVLSPDRSKILYHREDPAGSWIMTAGADGGQVKTLAPLLDGNSLPQSYSWSLDGMYAVLNRYAVNVQTGRRSVYAGELKRESAGAPAGGAAGLAAFSPDGGMVMAPAQGGPILLRYNEGGLTYDTSSASEGFMGLEHISWLRG